MGSVEVGSSDVAPPGGSVRGAVVAAAAAVIEAGVGVGVAVAAAATALLVPVTGRTGPVGPIWVRLSSGTTRIIPGWACDLGSLVRAGSGRRVDPLRGADHPGAHVLDGVDAGVPV